MTENEFLLQDRIQKIQQIINQYGENNFCISFSGGKDSTVLSNLVDLAIPGNKIPRVYINTGIEYNLIVEFVKNLQTQDDRIIIVKPKVPIKPMLEREGYPFKSKEHSAVIASYQHGNIDGKWITSYKNKTGKYKLLDILKYQLTPECTLKISDKCCYRLKEQPFHYWQKENNRPYVMIGVMRSEGGRRSNAKCLVFNRDKLKAFQPLSPMTKDWENWFIHKYHINLCDIYGAPYYFERTGCKGCPFNPNLQQDLYILKYYFPNEYKQCELIWKPVYEEYRKLGYRLHKKKNIKKKLF